MSGFPHANDAPGSASSSASLEVRRQHWLYFLEFSHRGGTSSFRASDSDASMNDLSEGNSCDVDARVGDGPVGVGLLHPIPTEYVFSGLHWRATWSGIRHGSLQSGGWKEERKTPVGHLQLRDRSNFS
ncbi:hypothetical protein DPEC_G00088230 [Dallia pectoralis]|uniref:Uncharacterized protein n=1 Tax=Dallia pectoralis TaxID=75939 RepID=A0ACC2H012_DALPE|nr:hypothetical protein DPEC_G00088230 [Dallia pectoralis]